MAWTWPFAGRGPARPQPAAETKNAAGFVALHVQHGAAWTRRDYAGLAREGFMRNPVAHRAVRLVAETAAAVPLGLTVDGRASDTHPALDLLRRPNGRQSGTALLDTLYGHLMLAGSAYLELTEAGEGARELHVLRPDRTSVVADAAGWPVALEHRSGASRRRLPVGAEPGPGGLQLTLFHPLDDHYGFAPLEAAAMALDIHNAAGRWNKALLDNSARPSGALVYAPRDGGNLTDEQFERLKAELEEGYAGVTRAGRPLLLDGGLDWKAMGLTPHDMDFVEAKNAASRDIALAFGVPPMLLGIPGDNTYANYQEANRAFYRLTLLPLVVRVAGDLAHWLSAKFAAPLTLAPDLDAIEALGLEREALWRRVGAAEFISNDEKRAAVGYGPRD